MSDKKLVLAFFDNEAAADAAAENLKHWSKDDHGFKLDAIGILAKDESGKVKTHKVGSHKTGTGVVLGIIAAALSGGITLIGGVIGGFIIGAFFHKGLGLSKEDLASMEGKLDGGKAAVGALVKPEEAASVASKLEEYGGKPESYDVTDAAVEQAGIALEQAGEG